MGHYCVAMLQPRDAPSSSGKFAPTQVQFFLKSRVSWL